MGARKQKLLKPLTPASMLKCIGDILPARNGYLPVNLDELVGEARRFGIVNLFDFRKLLLKYRKVLAEQDYFALKDPSYIGVLRADLGDATVLEMSRKQRCFGWEALVRFAYEREFGDLYAAFARQRDSSNQD